MIRAEQILILGVAGLGIYALYRMSKSEKEIPSQDKIKPTPEITPTGVLPNIPGAIPQLPAGTATVQGNPIQLTNSRAYLGRIETINPQGNSFTAPFSVNTSKEELVDALTNFGFDAVRVYMTPQEASRAIPQNPALGSPGRGTRWFYGRWLGRTGPVARPDPLVLLWITKGPPVTGNLLSPSITPEKARALGMCNYSNRWKYPRDYYNNCIAGAIFNPEMTERFQFVMKD